MTRERLGSDNEESGRTTLYVGIVLGMAMIVGLTMFAGGMAGAVDDTATDDTATDMDDSVSSTSGSADEAETADSSGTDGQSGNASVTVAQDNDQDSNQTVAINVSGAENGSTEIAIDQGSIQASEQATNATAEA